MAANRMSKLEVFIGTWNTTGEVLETEANPAGTLVTTDTYRWLPGRHFIVHDVDARFDGNPTRSMEVMGFDATKKQFFARSHDDQGSTEAFVVSLDGRRWTITGKTVRFCELTFHRAPVQVDATGGFVRAGVESHAVPPLAGCLYCRCAQEVAD